MKYGVELEFKKIDNQPEIPSGWVLRREALCYRPYVVGDELKTPILTSSESIETIADTVKRIKELNPYKSLTDSHCGLHVHIDKSSLLDKAKFIGVFVFAERFIFKLHPESRQDNDFCLRIKNKVHTPSLLRGEVYGLNDYKSDAICERNTFGTYEIRHAANKIDKAYIRNWISLIILIYLNHNKADLRSLDQIDGFLNFLSEPCDDDYIKSRQHKIIRWVKSKQ